MRWLAIACLLAQPACADGLVATRTLPAGTIIGASDVAVLPGPEGGPADPAHIIGQELRNAVYAGRPIPATALRAPTLVARNQTVTLVYEQSALRIEVEGRALSAGSIGQSIRVINNASRITVSGRVAADGTVVVEQN